jgi:hypothetical protein
MQRIQDRERNEDNVQGKNKFFSLTIPIPMLTNGSFLADRCISLRIFPKLGIETLLQQALNAYI